MSYTEKMYAIGSAEKIYTIGQAEKMHAIGQTEKMHAIGQAEKMYAVDQTEKMYAIGQAEKMYAVDQEGCPRVCCCDESLSLNCCKGVDRMKRHGPSLLLFIDLFHLLVSVCVYTRVYVCVH